MTELTREEVDLIVNVISQIRLNPLQSDSAKIVELSQSVVKKLTTPVLPPN